MPRLRSGMGLAVTVVALAAPLNAQPRRPGRRPATPVSAQSSTERACVPGAQTRCDCVSGVGVQVCNGDGSGYGACACGNPTSPAIPAVVPSVTIAATPTYSVPPVAPAFDPVAVRGRRNWYGWQVLLVDVGSIAVNVVGIVAESRVLSGVGAIAQFIGAPIVHWTHRRVGFGFASLGVRLGLPLLGALVGYTENACPTDSYGTRRCGSGGIDPALAILLGAGIGQIVASIVDIAAFSTETVEGGQARAAPRGAAWSLSVAPTLGGAQLGLGATF